ncbi:hypothetical protein GH714_009994 [Hevea brasiliensis]|uniref:TOG domain-containing protein n=1 Tax=Hevea brasiliensis TaxID=3981 RepID=A0A6A6KJN9_HEVBR|nr:hypothetical protein GH714_009994 [Hevea brasiliensis]
MAKDGPNWEGLLKWSLAHSDGTGSNRNLSEEDRKWFMEAMQAQSVDVIKRMKEITLVMQTPEQVLEAQRVTPADIEDMLEELQEHVESIDMANDLHSIGGLVPLLGYLKNSHANIRAKAADVVTTIVQNNPRSQQLVMEANGLEPLLSNFTSDPDVTVRTKALGAISSLIRHNKLGITAFRLANGYAGLRDALVTGKQKRRTSYGLTEKVLVIRNYKHIDGGDLVLPLVVSELGFPRMLLHLASSEDAEVREAALRGLLELARDKKGANDGGLGEEDEKLKQLLEERIKGISLMSSEDLEAAREERQLVDSLWNAHCNEPSSLREKGLLVLPGEDSLPPDVASKHFEPPLRAWAANQSTDGNSSTEKKQIPLLLGSGPPPEAANAQGTSSAEVNIDEQNSASR